MTHPLMNDAYMMAIRQIDFEEELLAAGLVTEDQLAEMEPLPAAHPAIDDEGGCT